MGLWLISNLTRILYRQKNPNKKGRPQNTFEKKGNIEIWEETRAVIIIYNYEYIYLQYVVGLSIFYKIIKNPLFAPFFLLIFF